MKLLFKNRMKGKSKKSSQDSDLLCCPVSEWYQSPLGLEVFKAEKAKTHQIISRLFGYHILQVGLNENFQLIQDSPAGHKLLFSTFWRPGIKTPVANIEELPLAHDSIDAIVVYHALDFTTDSHRLLRELTRVLRPGGQMLIIGFNPISFWGLFRLFTRKRNIPWRGRFLSFGRLNDWIRLLNLQIDTLNYGVHFPPFKFQRLLRRAEKIERIGTKLKNPFGGSYFVHCVKRASPITPVVSKRRTLAPRTAAFPLTENARVKIH